MEEMVGECAVGGCLKGDEVGRLRVRGEGVGGGVICRSLRAVQQALSDRWAKKLEGWWACVTI